MPDFIIGENEYDEEKAATLGNRYLIGNGYIGIRGTLDEYTSELLPAINLAGIYDRAGEGWREPINLPNGCYTYLKVDGEIYKLPDRQASEHHVKLNYRYGLFSRLTTWHTDRGNISLIAERFASMDNVHVIGNKYTVTADFHADVELLTGIDCVVWDLNGPHLERVIMEDKGGDLLVQASTHEEKKAIAVAETVKVSFPAEVGQLIKGEKILHKISFVTKPGEDYTAQKWVVIYTSNDCPNPVGSAMAGLNELKASCYEEQLDAHKSKWDELWLRSEVTIEGDEEADRALNYSLYHLHSIAPRHTKSLSIPARGLSGQTYKGAVFWDTEMFMLDFFMMTDPDTARTLMRYRIDTLEGALKKAKSYGFEGAFYAWESQEGGYDACSDYNVTDVFTGRPMRTFFKDKQMHITSAVCYGICRYVDWTGDESLLDEKGVKTIIECANFYYSLLLKFANKDYYELHDCIGPDEYHERINNNAYTNRMAKYTFEKAVEVIEKAMKNGTLPEGYDGKRLMAKFNDAASNLYIPKPCTDENDSIHSDVIEQFDGYFKLEDASLSEVRGRLLHEKEYWGGAYGVASHTQVIKQADVVTMLNLFSDEYDEEILRKNWEFYEPRTEHGSSLSAGMYSMLACKIGEPDRAYPFFIKSASADIKGGGKEWAGLVYIGGTHPAAAGAAYMTAIEGFAGVRIKNGKLTVNPSLPKSIKGMRFKIFHMGKEYEIEIKGNLAQINEC